MSDLENRPPDGPEHGNHPPANLGMAGAMARFFINSPLSPLLYMAMLMLGILGLLMTPRQEDPQISVPMVDLIVQYPGAEPEQVASLAVQPLERIMYEIAFTSLSSFSPLPLPFHLPLSPLPPLPLPH